MYGLLKFFEESVRTWKIVRHSALGARDHFFDRLTGPDPIDIEMRVADEVVSLDERLCEVNRIGDHAHAGENVAMLDEMLGQRCAVAFGQSVPAQPALLHVRRVYGQRVALPFARRESHPGVKRGFGRMRPPVHPNRARLLIRAVRDLAGRVQVPPPAAPDSKEPIHAALENLRSKRASGIRATAYLLRSATGNAFQEEQINKLVPHAA